jgi:hypothetical protein
MEPISEELVEKTWQKVAGLSPARANKEMLKVGQGQPDLLAFLMEFTEERDLEARELAIYMFFCRVPDVSSLQEED